MNRFVLSAVFGLASLAAFAADGKRVDENDVDGEGVFHGKGYGVTGTRVASDWGLEPLGGVGKEKLDARPKAQPTFRPAPRYRKGPVLCGGGVKGAVVFAMPAPSKREHWRVSNRYAEGTNLVNEIARHLSVMCGEKVAVTNAMVSGPAVVLEREDGDEFDEHMSVRTEGNKVYVRGSNAGLSHAVTYFLEALGCRYLWPGDTGKVIPRRKTVHLPVIDFTGKPAMRTRCMRGGIRKPWRTEGFGATRAQDALAGRGVDPEAWRLAFNAAYDPRPKSERDFYRWHGILDNDDCFVSHGMYAHSRVSEGHCYAGWGEKYGKDHEDWFALQPSGSRDPVKAGIVARPCFCYSNEEFIRAASDFVLERFAKLDKMPWIPKESVTVSPPDGGSASLCLCERCRKLDPENAARIPFAYRDPVSGQTVHTNYVALTDRMYWFFNRVMEQVREKRPEKRITAYAYSNFAEPPVSVRPDKGIVVFNVSGSYASSRRWNWAKENVITWLNLGMDVYWRPNALNGWRPVGPQNLSRRLFSDLELFKQNGIKGTDFDCVVDSWSTRGLDYYVVAKAHLNYDRLAYDDLLDDYCRAGFGKAASVMKRYFLEVERMSDAAAVACGEDLRPEYDASFAFASWHYLEATDPDLLRTLLTKARNLAGDDPEVQRRIRFIAVGVKALAQEKRIAEEFKKLCPPGQYVIRVSSPELDDLRRKYCEFTQKVCTEEPLAINYSASFWNAFNRAYRYARPKTGK